MELPSGLEFNLVYFSLLEFGIHWVRLIWAQQPLDVLLQLVRFPDAAESAQHHDLPMFELQPCG